MKDLRKAAVIGSGMVGSAISFSLMQDGLFEELVLLDIDDERAEGEAMDISHGIPYVKPSRISFGTYRNVRDADVVIITAGANQAVGESRNQLVAKNASIVRNIVQSVIVRNYNAIIIIVSNPVDVMTYVAAKTVEEFCAGRGMIYDSGRIIGSGTVLDTARLKHILSEKIGVSAECISAYVIGEHGDSEVIAWKSANAAGVPMCTLLNSDNNCRELEKSILNEVRNSAYEIIKRKSVTNYGIAMAVKRICEAIVRNENAVLPVSTILNGEYGLYNVALSIPVIVNSDGAGAMVKLPLSEEEFYELRTSANVIKDIIEANHL